MARVLSETEKQIYKNLAEKLVLKSESSYNRVSLQRSSDHHLMDDAVVYSVEGTDTVIVFGKFGRGYDINKLKEHFMKMQEESLEEKNEETQETFETEVTQEDEEKIKIIRDQINVTREEAVKALKECENDVLEALCKLSTN